MKIGQGAVLILPMGRGQYKCILSYMVVCNQNTCTLRVYVI